MNTKIGLKGDYARWWELDKVRIISVIKPQFRRPWCMVWYGIFPNSATVALLEFPQDDYETAKSSPINDPEEYRDLILDAEEQLGLAKSHVSIGMSKRLYDPEKVSDIKPGMGINPIYKLNEPCRTCLAKHPRDKVFDLCPHRLNYLVSSNSIAAQPLVAKAMESRPPKLLVIAANCPNYVLAKKKHAHVEVAPGEQATAETESIFKDFNDLDLCLFNSKMNIYKTAPEELKLYVSPYRERNQI